MCRPLPPPAGQPETSPPRPDRAARWGTNCKWRLMWNNAHNGWGNTDTHSSPSSSHKQMRQEPSWLFTRWTHRYCTYLLNSEWNLRRGMQQISIKYVQLSISVSVAWTVTWTLAHLFATMEWDDSLNKLDVAHAVKAQASSEPDNCLCSPKKASKTIPCIPGPF